MNKYSYILVIYFAILHMNLSAQICADNPDIRPYIDQADTTLCIGDCINLTGHWGNFRKTDSYYVAQLNYATYPIYPYAGTQISVNVDDVYSNNLILPFSFCFYNQNYSNAIVGSNGVITFNTALANGFCAWDLQNQGPIPNSAFVNPAIFGPYQDIDPSVSGQIFWQLTGVAPFRKFIASFKDVALFSSNCQTNFTPERSQIIMHESTNIIDIVIGSKSVCTNWNSGLAIEGIQNAGATKARTVPGRNNSVWSASQDVYRFCPVGDTIPPFNVTWSDSYGNQMGSSNNIQYCASQLPVTVYLSASYVNCSDTFTMVDSIVIQGDSSILGLTSDTAILDYPNKYFVEGCEDIHFQLAHNFCNTSDSVKVIPVVTGTVTNGQDFVYLDTFYVLPNQNYNGIIKTFQDGITEGFENATIYFLLPEYNDTLNSQLRFTLYDSIYVEVPPFDNTKCPGESISIGVQGADTVSYMWSPVLNLTSINTQSTTAVVDYPITYTINANWLTCPTVTRSFPIQVDTFSLSIIPADTEVCFGIPFSLRTISTIGYPNMTWSWTPRSAVLSPDSMNTSVYPTQDINLDVVGTTLNGCSQNASTTIKVREKDFMSLKDTFLSACPHVSLDLEASGAVNYQWVPGLYLSDSLIANPISNPFSPIIYTVYGIDDLGCIDTGKVEVELVPAAVVELGDDITLYPSESAELTALGNCSYFEWTPASYLSMANVSNPTVSYSGQNILYVVKGTTEKGCSMLDSMWVRSELGEIITLPNAFTPGGDGQSSPTLNIITRGIIKLNYYRIFNRWGELVFETKDLAEGWDGTYKGVPQPMGTYIWDVNASQSAGKIIHITGNTMLIR